MTDFPTSRRDELRQSRDEQIRNFSFALKLVFSVWIALILMIVALSCVVGYFVLRASGKL